MRISKTHRKITSEFYDKNTYSSISSLGSVKKRSKLTELRMLDELRKSGGSTVKQVSLLISSWSKSAGCLPSEDRADLPGLAPDSPWLSQTTWDISRLYNDTKISHKLERIENDRFKMDCWNLDEIYSGNGRTRQGVWDSEEFDTSQIL